MLQSLGLVAAACLYATAPRYGRPFFIVGMAMVAQAVLVETLGAVSYTHLTLPTILRV